VPAEPKPEVEPLARDLGIVSEVIPVFSRKPIFGYIGLIAATISIAGLSATVWAHHMFATGGGAAPVLLHHVLPHRGADRREVLQLDRHDVEGFA
jgi:hypothetical protein